MSGSSLPPRSLFLFSTLLLFFTFLLSSSNAEIKSSTYENLCPPGWKILEEGVATGLINNDSVEDVVIAVEQLTGGPADNAPPARSLLVFLGRNNGGFQLHTDAKKALLKLDEGGAMGDPFVGITLEERVLKLSFYGGSAWRWAEDYKFRFQDKDIYLIGATTQIFDSDDPTGGKTIEINYESGYKEEIEGETKNREKLRKRNAIKLRDFDAAHYHENGG